MAHFLRTAGYLLAKGVFSREETARLQESALEHESRARRGDKRSWWEGTPRAKRCSAASRAAARSTSTCAGSRATRGIASLAALSHHALVPRDRWGDGVAILIKNPR
jgi:hypothetical protein